MNRQSWNGKNGTGNLSHYGCDRDFSCVYLAGGQITCRHGVCFSYWQNKNYSYTLSSPITSLETVGNESEPPTILTVSDGDRILFTEKLYPQPFDNQ